MLIPYFVATLVAFLLNVAFILMQVSGKLPFGLYDFIFLAGLILALALYRPRYIFWLFIATLPLETVIISPTEMPISLRPFQLLGAVLILATLILWTFKKLDFSLLSFKKIKLKEFSPHSFGWLDWLIFSLPLFAVLAIFFSPMKAMAAKQTLVLISFIALYWLARNYLQTNKDKFEALWFFVIGIKVSLLFGIYQALAYKFNWSSFEVMVGRVNSTLTEPDWLGMYLVFAIALVLWARLYFLKNKTNIMLASWNLGKVIINLSNLFLVALIFVLILTVARSAWLALFGVFVVYLFLILFVSREETSASQTNKINSAKIKLFFQEGISLFLVVAISFAIIEYFSLSSFHLLNRAASSVSGLQKITISCQPGSNVPTNIQNVDELAQYNCRHINLEEISAEQISGQEVKEVFRPDPNVNIRQEIYGKTWQQIKQHPIFGQGLGVAQFYLGQDERGAGFNASNIFLDAWFSMGLGGLISLLIILVLIPLTALVQLFQNHQAKITSICFILLTATAFFIPNQFNTGLLIGFFWIWLALFLPAKQEMAS